MRSLTEYRAMYEDMAGCTVPVERILEVIAAAEAEVEDARGEFTLAQAMEKSGRSRSYFERRVRQWAAEGLARKPGREWLLKGSVIPPRIVHGGFDPSLSAEELVDELDRIDRLAS